MTTLDVAVRAADQRAPLEAVRSTGPRITLAPYQSRAVEALAVEMARTHALIARTPGERAGIARERGVHLLAAPTGSGKTLILGRSLETLVPEPIVPAAGFRGSVWFWFAPYSGLVEQTRLALRADCPGLRLRDLSMDREPTWTRDGDTFVHTWGSVAANNREARRLRRSGESALSVDDLIATLRDDGFFIGCVIDEAHLNFGMGAKAAADFYLEHLRPDVTVLSTATPRDAKLAAFSREAGLGEPHRVEISRAEAVAARLMKPGLIAAHLVLTDEQRMALDPDETIVRAAWERHKRVKERLARHDVELTPLLLVQVPNDTGGEAREVDRAKAALLAAGAPEDAIRIHTSGQPDPEFRALAADEDVEALIFKLSAATGFDAPRAFSLVSLRPIISPDFGVQVMGRVMRVDRRVRANAAALADPLLSRGTVFLSDRDRQGGLDAAAESLAALRTSIETVTPQLSLAVFGGSGLEEAGADFIGAERAITLDITNSGNKDEAAGASPPAEAANAIAHVMAELGEEAAATDIAQLDMLGGAAASPDTTERMSSARPGQAGYARGDDLGVPERLRRERAPQPAELPKLAEEAAEALRIDERVLALLVRPETVNVELKLRELLLGGGAERSERLVALPSPAKLAEAAQHALAFSDDVDPRLFRRHLVRRFAAELAGAGASPRSDAELGRVIDQIAVFQSVRIEDALAHTMAGHVSVVQADPLPTTFYDAEGRHEAQRAAYGVFPSGLNGPERRFAELIDAMNGVLWWLRNPSHPKCLWSVRLVLPNGRGFYPDFVVGVAGRRTVDGIRLAEVKDDGTTGRLHSDENRRKFRARHREYLDVLWVAEDEEGSGRFERLGFSDDENRIVSRGSLTAEDLRD